jgi:hypothetical protein
MLYKGVVVRENALKQILGKRELLTDEEWNHTQKEVEAGIAVQLALGFSDEEQKQLESILSRLDPILADKDGSVLKPVVDSLKQMYKRLA